MPPLPQSKRTQEADRKQKVPTRTAGRKAEKGDDERLKSEQLETEFHKANGQDELPGPAAKALTNSL